MRWHIHKFKKSKLGDCCIVCGRREDAAWHIGRRKPIKWKKIVNSNWKIYGMAREDT